MLGLGNPFWGDDAAGLRVVELLRDEALPAGAEVREAGTPGLALLEEWRGFGRVFLVDAVDMGLKPGEWREFEASEARLVAGRALSAHGVGVAEAMELAKALGLPTPEVRVYGIQPGRVGPGEGLSPRVAEAVEEVKEAILEELRSCVVP